jgi:peptidoglycan hydrolase CwlO-like protein
MSESRPLLSRDSVLIVAILGLVVTVSANTLEGTNWLFGGTAHADAAIASLTQQVDRLSNEVAKLGQKIEEAPRNADFVDRDRRLTELATHVELTEQRVGKLEIDSAAVRERLNTLFEGTHAPIRIPR